MKKYIFKKDKFLVAGGYGMAGAAITKALEDKGYNNILKPRRNELDFSDCNKTETWFKKNKPQVVIVAAAKVGGILANSDYPADFILNNLKIQTNIIESAWRNNSRRLIFLGSSCIYPKFSQQPIQEESLLTGELEVTNEYYAIAKIAGIKLCNALRIQYGFDAISLMPTNLYGHGDNYHEKNSHVMAALIRRFYMAKKLNLPSVTCWGTGKPRREFMHVDDLGNAVVFVLEKWNTPLNGNKINPNIFHLNVGTGKDISIKELANLICKEIGYKGEIFWDETKPDGTIRKLLDVSRIKNLGWSSSINLEDGIKKTIRELKFEDFK
tara:strand:- start:36063 stop:37037 length:975 start_codon:yes stop_codon:yes gene_type:complete